MTEQTTLKIVCSHCGKDMGEVDGKGTTGTTGSVCRECWPKHYPGPYPEEEGNHGD